MELSLLIYFLVAPVIVAGEVNDARRPFVNHEDKQLAAQLLSPHEYEQFTTELLPYRYSNITLDVPGIQGFSLFARQECENAGYVPCPDDAAVCCPAGDNCVPDGCCSADQEQCGSKGCYDPTTEVCCEDSTSCPLGQDCVEGGCCPSGEVRCGTTSKCYDPDTSKCCQGNETVWACAASASCCGTGGCYDPTTETCCPDSSSCALGYDCVPGGCCPSGQVACGSSKCYDPDTQKCCQSSNTVWACPSTSSCCDVGYCYEPDSEQCCSGGSCPKEDICCEYECCLSIAYCGSDGYCTRTPSSPTPNKTPSSPTPSRTPTPTASETETPATLSTPSFPTSTSTQTSCLPSTLPTGATASDPGDYLLVNGNCLPVMDFVYVDGLTEELIESMCGGIQQQTGPAKLSNSMMVLTRQGFRRQTPACSGLCTGRIDPTYNERMECDEFPFGSTVEGGGADAHVMCIVWWQNSIQGALIRQYNNFYAIKTNDKFVVRILPNCDIVGSGGSKRETQDVQRRQNGQPSSQTVGNQTVLSSSYNIWQPSPAPGVENGTGYIFVPLGEVGPGVFDTKLSLHGNVEGLQIIDGDGIEYYSISNPAELENLNFNVSADDDLSISVPAPQNTTANISYTCTVSPFPSNTSTSKKSGACSTNDIIRTQFAGSAMLLVLAAWAFVF